MQQRDIGSTAATETRVFHRSLPKAVAGAIGASLLLSAITLFLLPRLIPRGTPISTRGMIVLLVAIALTVAVFASKLWLRNIRVSVGSQVVEIGRAGNRESYDRAATTFRSIVTEHRTNGLRTGVTRGLAVDVGGREITIPLPGYSRETFNELMSVLAPVAHVASADPVAAARERSQLPSQFAVDASLARRVQGILVISVVVLLLVTAILVVLLSTSTEPLRELIVLLTTAILTGLFGVVAAIWAAVHGRSLRAVPAHLAVSPRGISIDADEVPFDQLTRVWLSPTAYPTKRLRLERVGGRSRTYVLGSPRVSMAPSYAQFVAVLQIDASAHPGLLRMDLD